MSAQFYAAAVAANPEIPSLIAQGEFATLRAWLHHNIYQHGSKLAAADLVRSATGAEMSIDPYIAYLWSKYGSLYSFEERERR